MPDVRRAARNRRKSDPPERRALSRKHAYLSGVLTDLEAESAMPCTIRDTHARGAEIRFSGNVPRGAHVYLLDTDTRMVHLARVAWSSTGRCGLHFARSYPMGVRLPPHLRAFWRLFLESKLQEIERAVAIGASVESALRSAGLSREHLHFVARHASTDNRLEALVEKAKRLMAL
jgi:hypothetical protein